MIKNKLKHNHKLKRHSICKNFYEEQRTLIGKKEDSHKQSLEGHLQSTLPYFNQFLLRKTPTDSSYIVFIGVNYPLFANFQKKLIALCLSENN